MYTNIVAHAMCANVHGKIRKSMFSIGQAIFAVLFILGSLCVGWIGKIFLAVAESRG